MPRRLSLGELRQRIRIEAMTETPDGTGQPIPQWNEVVSVWGLFQATGGQETEDVGGQVRSVVLGTVTTACAVPAPRTENATGR